jgi:hypothetical protein
MRWVSFVVVLLVLALPGVATAATDWTEADKDGYGTSTTTTSKVWHTLDDGRLTEVFYPDLGTPSVRTLEFVVSDGKRFTQRDTRHSVEFPKGFGAIPPLLFRSSGGKNSPSSR